MYELAVKSEGKGHTHYPVPSNVSRPASNRTRENVRNLHAFIFACLKGRVASEIDGASGCFSGSVINASGFTHIASERRHDASKEKASG
jgi:hypothetical protein